MTSPATARQAGDGDAELSATCALAAVPGIGLKSLEILKKEYGTLAAAAAQGGAQLSKVAGLHKDGVEGLAKAGDLEARGAWLVEKAGDLGAQILLHDDTAYPARVKELPSAPPILYVLGTLATSKAVAVVGSRATDPYGDMQARNVVARLCAAGVDVVSGGAEGVDLAAHEEALKLGGHTTAVVGTGLLNTYPMGHERLYERIAKTGAVVSELALDAGGQPSHFPRRNRVIAGLSDAVVITRGRDGSGALSTCEAAHKLARPVFAVPGRVDEPLAFAPNSLLSSGVAQALVTGAEVLRALGLVDVVPASAPSPVESSVTLVPAAQKVLGALGPSARHIDELAGEAGLTTSEALVHLLTLELAGLCAARPGKYFQRR